MGIDHERLDDLRRGRGPIPEHVIDEFVGGRLCRRDFIRRSAAVGLTLPTIGAVLSACDSAGPSSSSSGVGEAGATITAGTIAPSAAPNPLLVIDTAGINLLNQVGEALVFYDEDNLPQPSLATSWDPNADGTVWTFKIRQGVKFSDGRQMTVDDVVYTYQSHSDPKNSGNALSVFAGVLAPSGVVKVDDETVAFHLNAAYGAFPYAVSQYNYNAIVVPNNTDYSKWVDTFIGTGPFMMKSFNQTNGTSLGRNPNYWGESALPAAVNFRFFADEQAMAAALQSGDIDCLGQFTVATSPQLLDEDSYNVTKIRSSAHRALSMRNDVSPLNSKYVRQAIALTLDRPGIMEALFKGNAQIGNDSPFAASFPMTDPSIPQRTKDLTRAKELLGKGGVPRGFATELFTERLQEMPQFAQVVKASAAEIGVDVRLNVLTIGQYYGDAVFGKSPWLDGQMSLVDYGARPVPNVFLQAPLQSSNAVTNEGSWNAAHFDNGTYNSLSKEYAAAIDLSTQRKLAAQIQTLLLDETPVIYPYFYDYLSASRKNVHGVSVLPSSQFFLNKVTKS